MTDKEFWDEINKIPNCRKCKHFQCFISAPVGHCRTNPKFADDDPYNPSIHPAEAQYCDYFEKF